MKFKAAVIQTNTPNNIEAAFRHVEELIAQAANKGAEFIATPEGTNLIERDRNVLKDICPFENDEKTLGFFAKLARQHNIHLLIGSALFQSTAGKAFNRSLLFAPNGEKIAQYDKIHLFDVNLGEGNELKESAAFQGGSKAIVAKTDLANIGLSICYDLRFPHLYRGLCQRGAQILTIPAAFTVPTGMAHWQTLLRARAIENSAFIIAPAQGGKHQDGRETFGHSMIINPWGEIIAHIPNKEKGFAIAEIDLIEVQEARRKIPSWNLNQEFDFND